MRDLKRHDRASGDAAIATLVGSAEEELETLRRVHQFIEGFRDGKVTLAEFLDGPDLDDDLAVIENVLGELATMMEDQVVRKHQSRRPRGKQGARSARSPRVGAANSYFDQRLI